MFNPSFFYASGARKSTLLAGLTHVFSFEESTGTTCFDSYTSSPINGTYVNGVTLGDSSPMGSAASFDGTNDHVDFANGNLGITSFPCSFAMLVFLPDITSARVLFSGTKTATYRGISFIQSNATLTVRFGDGAGALSNNRKDFTVSGLVAGWNRIIVNCFSFSSVFVYLNNTTPLSNTPTGTAATTDFTGATYVTNRYNTTYYNGKISELWTWNKTLSDAEISLINTMLTNGTRLIPPITTAVATRTVYNKGVGGDNTSDVIARFTNINSVPAQVAIVMIGLNDWRHPSSGKRRTTTQYQTNLTTIVQNQKALGRIVVLCNITPILPEESDYVCPFYSLASGCDSDGTGDAFRTKITDVATAESVYYFDSKAPFDAISEPSYTTGSYMRNALNSAGADGVHFRPVGAQFHAEKVFDFLVANGLDNYANYVCIGDSQTFGDGLSSTENYPYRLQLLLNA